MSHSTIPIPSDSVRESVGSSPSLAILSDTKAEVMTIPVVLPKIAPEVAAVVIVSLLTATPDLAIESDPEVEPSKAPPSEIPPSPDYPMKDEFESIEDVPETTEPLHAQVAPPVYNTPTLPISSAEPTSVIPHDTRATVTMSPTTSRLAAASAPVVLPSVPADRLPPPKRLRGSLAGWTNRDATSDEGHRKAVAAVSDCSDARQRAYFEDRGVPSLVSLGLG
ncbi:hypothetical protein Tco_1002134 [Tanacetum coccineum]|uniref:Uncharacterized protein n=1 Tax=Tanacetum coccineum TaxID=301880 RepID=A0ABQ5F5I8_9ASTR